MAKRKEGHTLIQCNIPDDTMLKVRMFHSHAIFSRENNKLTQDEFIGELIASGIEEYKKKSKG